MDDVSNALSEAKLGPPSIPVAPPPPQPLRLRSPSPAPSAGTSSIMTHDEPPAHTIACVFFKNGLCNKGDRCPYSHDLERAKMPLCAYWEKRGRCKHQDRCRYLHDGFDYTKDYHEQVKQLGRADSEVTAGGGEKQMRSTRASVPIDQQQHHASGVVAASPNAATPSDKDALPTALPLPPPPPASYAPPYPYPNQAAPPSPMPGFPPPAPGTVVYVIHHHSAPPPSPSSNPPPPPLSPHPYTSMTTVTYYHHPPPPHPASFPPSQPNGMPSYPPMGHPFYPPPHPSMHQPMPPMYYYPPPPPPHLTAPPPPPPPPPSSSQPLPLPATASGPEMSLSNPLEAETSATAIQVQENQMASAVESPLAATAEGAAGVKRPRNEPHNASHEEQPKPGRPRTKG